MARQTMFLYGKNSVQERLKTNPKSIRRIFLQDNFDAPHIFNLINSTDIPVRRVTEKELSRIKHADRLQGIVAEVDAFRYTPYDEILSNASKKNLSFIFLDNINDPHNLGSIIRTAACFGGFAIVIPKHSSCEVNETVIHVASGGENFISVSMVNNISNALMKAKKIGYWIGGAVVENGEDINNINLPFPLCLVMGSEGKGIRQRIKKELELRVNIPMSGTSLSFNVAMACAIFCYEISKQKARNRDIK